jgi:hypothetical protein
VGGGSSQASQKGREKRQGLSTARALANQKLHFAALHLRLLSSELARQDLPSQLLLEALGQSAQMHMQDAYGWFLLELAGIAELPATPPHSVGSAHATCPDLDLQRGELVELKNLEQREGWLKQLLEPRGTSASPTRPDRADILTTVESAWSEQQLQGWLHALGEIIERMSDSLDEW